MKPPRSLTLPSVHKGGALTPREKEKSLLELLDY